MPILEARKLVKSYGRRTVVKGVDLVLPSGEIIGLLGRNGAGKTTIFQMIVGLVRPDSGGIFLDGRDISHAPTHVRARAGLTYLPQENSIFLKATVLQNLLMSLQMQKGSGKARIRTAYDLLEEFGLRALAAQPAHSLSGGERRRLEICRALTVRPKFLLLDEPFTGIDPLTIVEIQKLLSLLKGRGIGILISDHNVRDTFRITDRACIIDEGELLIQDVPEKVAVDRRARERFLGAEFTVIPVDTMDFPVEGTRRAVVAAPAKATDFASPGLEIPDAGTKDEEAASRPIGSGFFRRIGAPIFDLMFVAVLWLAAVGLAALLMNANASRLVRTAMLPLGLLFAVLFSVYLFLFSFFLGETLGGRLIPRRGGAEPAPRGGVHHRRGTTGEHRADLAAAGHQAAAERFAEEEKEEEEVPCEQDRE